MFSPVDAGAHYNVAMLKTSAVVVLFAATVALAAPGDWKRVGPPGA